MKKYLYFATLLSTVLGLTSCSQAVEKAIENKPEIVFKAIEKSPKGFFETIQKAQLKMQQITKDEAEAKAIDALEKDFKNPKKPVIGANRAIFGNPKATVTIVEFSDFLCPYCAQAAKTMKQIFKEYGKDVRLLYKHLPFKPMARPAAKYYEAIVLQSPQKAKKFHDLLYANQEKLYKNGEAYLKTIAKKVGANMKKLAKDKDSKKIDKIISEDMAEAKKFQLTGTPGFVVGGVLVKGAYPFEHFKKIIDRHLKK